MLYYNITLTEHSQPIPMHTFIRSLSFLFLSLLLSSQSIAADNTPPLNVVVTIKPLHSLVASLMKGVIQPQLLLTSSQSAHHTNLRPSDYRKLADADIVFWAGASLESFIPAVEKKHQGHTQYISLIKTDGLTLLPIRGKQEHSHHENHHSNHTDPHFWLSTINAKIIVSAITQKLIDADAVNSSLYLRNKEQTLARLNVLSERLTQKLENNTAPFITYHDAYQYFENENKLTGAHFVTTSTEHSPGIKRIKDLKHLIDTENIQCVFYEPPNIPPLLNTLLEKKSVRLLPIDPAGTQIASGKTHYFELMSQTAKKIHGCLSTITRN